MGNKEFAGKVALITGASRGIGRALAIQLAGCGVHVVLNYRKNQEEAEEVLKEIEKRGSSGLLCQADMEDREQIMNIFEDVEKHFGKLDILVANAASTAFKPLKDIKPYHIERTFAISVRGFITAVQQATFLMGTGGRIVGVSGFDSFTYLPNHGVLGAAKAAMESLIRYWACELAPQGINVNGVCPGYVDTDSARIYSGSAWEDNVEKWSKAIPKGRLATPEEIASTILFFCSPYCEYITGQTLVVDGGITLVTP